MGYEDKSLTCVECGANFVFTASEQEFFNNKGFSNEPRRCYDCREARRQQRGDGGYRRPREMFPATCATCGVETQVPFEPREGRPVYCSDCFVSQKR